MKKTKTLLSRLIIMLVSFFATACSCSGGDGDINHIYPQDLNIRCVTSNDSVSGTVDEVDGDLNIVCREGDRFVIEYEITPSNATKTQVNWEFENNSRVVEPYKRNYSQTKSTKEQVEFVALSEGETTLTFRTAEPKREAKCYITVHEPYEELATLAEPTNVRFNNDTNTLEWNPVYTAYEPNSVNATSSGYVSAGHIGYEVVSMDPVTGEVLNVETLASNVTSYSGIEAGKEYAIKVRAIGNPYLMLNSNYSATYRFYKLETATDIANSNGTISFTTPAKSSKITFYHFGMDYDYLNTLSKTVTAETTYNFYHTEFPNYSSRDVYNITTISYPKDYNATQGYAVVGIENPVFYFPSDPSTPLEVQKLNTTTATLSDGIVNNMTIAGATFNNVHASTGISFIVDRVEFYPSKFEQKFYYELYSSADLTTPITTGTTEKSVINLTELSGVQAGGSYVIKVQTVGNIANTIQSSVTSMAFNVQTNVTSDTVQLQEDILKNNPVYYTGGLEVFFVNTTDKTKSYYKALTGDNINEFALDEIGLAPGDYDVYAKDICYIEDGYQNAVITPSSFSKLFTISVANNVANDKINKDGDILFTKINAYDVYEIVVGRREKGTIIYNESSVCVYPATEENILAGVPTYEYNAQGFEIENANIVYTAKTNITDIIEYLIENNKISGIEDSLQYFSSDYEFYYKVITVGDIGSDSGDNVISSIGTSNVEAYVYNSVGAMTLNNYTVSFERIGTSNSQKYVVTLKVVRVNNQENTEEVINEYNFVEFTGTLSGSTVNVNLNNLVTSDGKKFVDLINKTGSYVDGETTYTIKNYVTVSALGYDGKVNSPAMLNSLPSETAFNITNKPINLMMSDDGYVSWSTSTQLSVIDNYNYTIYFYEVTNNGSDNEYSLLKDDTIANIQPNYTTEDVMVDENIITRAVFRANIGDVLAKYQDKVIAIEIVENNPGMFSGVESDMLYATRISSPVLSRVTDEGKDLISWLAISNADVYDISVTMDEVATVEEEPSDEENDEDIETDAPFSYSVIGQGGTTFSITDRINDSTNSWGVGTYYISVSARNSKVANVGLSADAPFVLTSVATTTTVYIVSRSIIVSVNDNTLSWNNINEKADYSISYTLSNGEQSSYTPEGGETTNLIPLENETTYDVSHFTAGANSVIIVPTINFVDSAFILIGNTATNSINKLETATGLTSEGGNFVFNLHGFTDADAVQFELYEVNDDSETIISPNNYYLLNNAPETKTDGGESYLKFTVVLDGVNAGSLTLKVRLKSSGVLSSDISESYTGTKIEAVSDFTKTGEWLSWTAQPGISSYEISYRLAGSTTVETLVLRVEENGGVYTAWTKKIEEADGEGSTGEIVEVVDPTIFYYNEEENKFYHKFDHELFVGDKTGDILFTIRPLTNEEGYFSGNTSSITTITKLNANSAITVEDGKVVIADYEADGSATPVQYTVTVYKLKTVTSEGAGEETTTQVVRETDYNGNYVAWTETKGYTILEGLDITPIDLNTLSYNAVIDAQGTTQVIEFKADGDYEIEVTYIGDGNSIITSSTIIKSDLDKLSISSLSTSDGEVVWGVVDGAENYTVEITDGTNTYYFDVASNTLKGQTLTLPVEDNTGSEDENNGENGDEIIENEPVVTSTDGGIFTFDAGKVYTIRIKANATGKLHSQWSNPFNVQKLYAPTSVIVSATSSSRKVIVEVTTEVEEGVFETTYEEITIPVNSPIVSWLDTNTTSLKLDSEIKYNDSIKYNIPYAGTVLKDDQGYIIGTSSIYTIDTNLPVGSYNLQLRVFGNTSTGTDNIGYLTSDYSIATVVNYVDEVNAPTISNGNISWKDISGAYSYKITAYYTSDYNNYIADPDSNTLTSVFETYTTNNTLNLASMSMSTLNTYNGSFTFVVNAITNPFESIVTSVTTSDNTVAVYKPNVLESYKIKNGMLSWRIAIADVKDFVAGQMIVGQEGTTTNLSISDEAGIDKSNVNEVTQYILQYITNRINSGLSDNPDLEAQLSHLLGINLDINNVYITDIPTEAYIIDVANNTDGSSIENIIYDITNFADGEYIEYFYDVSIEPEIDNTSGTQIASAGVNTAGVQYEAGKYTIRISAQGNANTTVPVIGGGYTTAITAYKPNTPITWTTGGADISYGQVQWELSTTQASTIDNFVYYEDYRITAIPVDGEGIKSVDVSVSDTYVEGTGNPNLKDDYKYYRDLKGDLFTADTEPVGNDVLFYNTNYRLLIRTIGTADSSLLGTGATLYLNSNACVVNNVANILDTTPNVKIQNSELSWGTSNGSTSTKVFIYGPFNNLNTAGTAVNKEWASDQIGENTLATIDAVYYGETSNTSDIENYRGMLRIQEFDASSGDRITQYSMTNAILNNRSFEPGGYIIKMQELGDDKGIVDSEISEGYEVIKLGYAAVRSNETQPTVIMQSSGWVGTLSSVVYVWDSQTDTWITKRYPEGSPNQVIGTFVWNPVAGANAYKIETYRVPVVGGASEWIITEYSTETTYELPSGSQYNDNSFLYYIVVTALRIKTGGEINFSQLSDNYFSADNVDSSSHARLEIPKDLTIFGTGDIQWDNGIEYTTVGGYRVQFNFGAAGNDTEIIGATNNNSEVPTLNLGDGSQNGTIAISVKSVPVDGNGYLNSSYCSPVTVTRLADPDVRLIDGVLYWGSSSDPVTATELTINGNKQIISTLEGEVTYNTYYKYFTEITAHDENYLASTDEETYPAREHNFEVMFQGTGGEDGLTMGGSEIFYIASNLKTLTATKLDAPVIENVQLDVANTSENMIRWEFDNRVSGYRVRVFSSTATDGSFKQTEITKNSLDALLSSGSTTADFIVKNENGINNVYFKLNDIIEELNLTTSGGIIYVYVQALGSGAFASPVTGEGAVRPEFNGSVQTNRLYLSSSYSTPTSIGVPPEPTNLSYDQTTGIVSWAVNFNAAYNIKLETEYKVENVTATELTNYWRMTSDVFYFFNENSPAVTPEGLYKPYEEIINRTTTIIGETEEDNETLYTIKVVDVIRLLASKNDNKTPTSYTLTSIGTEYKISVTAMSFITDTDDETFASDTVTLSSVSVFQLFGRGDGSESYPYTIENSTELQTISLFTSRNFVVINNITMIDAEGNQINWKPISGTFTGTIDGQGNTIKSFKISAVTATGSNSAIMAFVENNNGTIKNMNFEIVSSGLSYVGVTNGISIATIAITNSGIIDNVTVKGDIIAQPSDAGTASSVAGIAITNTSTGIINKASVNLNLVALDNTTSTTSAGGITRTNRGTITGSVFNGTIKANTVGGITAVNNGAIDRCYVSENSIIYATDAALSNSNTRKGAIAGGIAARMLEHSEGLKEVSITNSYSLATINVFKGGDSSSASYTVGGLVASVDGDDNIYIANSYVVVKIINGGISGSNTINVFYMIENNSLVAGEESGNNLENNYYLVLTCEISTNSSRNDAGAKEVGSLSDLETALSTLRDSNGNLVYTIHPNTGDSTTATYPTLREVVTE